MTEFRIADTFTDSLARLMGDEQKLAKTTAFDLQLDPVNPGMQLRRLERGKDRNFWSLRVGLDLRMIVHRTEGSMLLRDVAHHDDAYRWDERRRLEAHPKTGAAQFVEIRERVETVTVTDSPAPAGEGDPADAPARPAPQATKGPAIFAAVDDDTLQSFGVAARLAGRGAGRVREGVRSTGGRGAPDPRRCAHPRGGRHRRARQFDRR